MDNSGRTTGRKMRCRRLANLNDDVEITLAYFRRAIKRPDKCCCVICRPRIPTRNHAHAQAAEPRRQCTEPLLLSPAAFIRCAIEHLEHLELRRWNVMLSSSLTFCAVRIRARPLIAGTPTPSTHLRTRV